MHWANWLDGLGGEKVAAPQQLGNLQYTPIEPAPGRYVLGRC